MKIAAMMMALMLGANAAVACPAGLPCFTVHGRLQAWNGNPTFRIWRIGTRRVLGVHDEALPPVLLRAFGADAFGKRVTADFKVCPLTRQRKGRMQMVCVAGARGVTVRGA
jgi:hypothetical protein